MKKMEIAGAQWDTPLAWYVLNSLPLNDLKTARLVSKNWYDVIESLIWPKDFKTVTAVFEEVVAQFGAREYIRYKDIGITYKEANNRANKIAHHLLSLNLPYEARVCVYLPHAPSLFIAILGILKAGLVYVPLPYTKEISDNRILICANECNPHFLISHKELVTHPVQKKVSALTKLPSIYLDDLGVWQKDDSELELNDIPNPNKEIAPNQLAYIMYTSGSTGTPNPTETEHKGLLMSIQANTLAAKIKKDDRVIQQSGSSFDAHEMEFGLPFSTGEPACLYIFPRDKDGRLPIEGMSEFCEVNQITVGIFTPSTLEVLDRSRIKSVRVIFSVGERIYKKCIDEYAQLVETFINGLGFTQATICTTLGVYDPSSGKIHVGRPIPGSDAFLVKCDDLMISGSDTVHEMAVSGYGLARGYRNKPTLTNKKFRWIPHPNDPASLVRVFMTGDRAQLNEDNNFEILSRLDRQLKVHGKAICPEEIEHQLNQKDDAIKVYLDEFNPDPEHQISKIVAYMFCDHYEKIEKERLLSYLQDHLTSAMYPSLWVGLPSKEHGSVLSPNGKLDRSKLKTLNNNYKMQYLVGYSGIKPRDNIEEVIEKIWFKALSIDRDYLQGDHIYIDTNFFHLGGTSVLGVLMLKEVAEFYKLDKFNEMVERFLDNPTLGGLARIVRERTLKLLPTPAARVVLKRTYLEGTQLPKGVVPVHMPPSLMGDPEIDYNYFINQFRDDSRLIFGYKALGLHDEKCAQDNITEIARSYLSEIFSVQPHEPYVFVGWSAGGWDAYIMGRLAQQLGKRSIVIMIDTEGPDYFRNRSVDDFKKKYLFRLIQYSYVSLKLGMSDSEIDSFINSFYCEKNLLIEVVHEFFNGLLSRVREKTENKSATNFLQMIRGVLVGALTYNVAPYADNVTLIAASESQTKMGDKRLGWPNDLPLNLISVQGNHFNIIIRDENDRDRKLPIDYAELINEQIKKILSECGINLRSSSGVEKSEGYGWGDFYQIYLDAFTHGPRELDDTVKELKRPGLSREARMDMIKGFDQFVLSNSLSLNGKHKKIAGHLLLQAAWYGQIEFFDHLVSRYKVDYFTPRNDDGSDALHHSTWNGQPAMFRHLVKKYQWPLHNTNTSGLDLLLHAACNGQIEMFDLLVSEYRWNLKAVSADGDDALVCAVFNSKTELFDHLVEKYKWDLSATNASGEDLLQVATNAGQKKMIQHLVTKYNWAERSIKLMKAKLIQLAGEGENASIDIHIERHKFRLAGRDRKLGFDMILRSSWCGKPATFDHLAKNYKVEYFKARNDDGSDALHHSAWNGQIHMLDHLISVYRWPLTNINNGGYDLILHATYGSQLEMFDHLHSVHRVALNSVDKNGNDALLSTVSTGNTEFLTHLVTNYDWSLKVENFDGENAMDIAVRTKKTSMQQFLRANYDWSSAYRRTETALIEAAIEGNTRAFDAEVRSGGIDFFKRHKKLGFELILKAAWSGKIAMFDHMVEVHRISYFDARNNDGSDALHHTAWFNQPQMLDHLIEKYKWPLNNMNRGGLDLLLHAASGGSLATFRKIHENYHADLDTISTTGNNALMCALISEDVDLIKYLLENFSWDLDQKNDDNMTVSTLVDKIDNKELEELIEDYQLKEALKLSLTTGSAKLT